MTVIQYMELSGWSADKVRHALGSVFQLRFYFSPFVMFGTQRGVQP